MFSARTQVWFLEVANLIEAGVVSPGAASRRARGSKRYSIGPFVARQMLPLRQLLSQSSGAPDSRLSKSNTWHSFCPLSGRSSLRECTHVPTIGGHRPRLVAVGRFAGDQKTHVIRRRP